jgi:hypothetical protein
MSDPAKAVAWAGMIGTVILVGPLALFAAGLINGAGVLVLQGLALGGVYLLAVTLRNRRDQNRGD